MVTKTKEKLATRIMKVIFLGTNGWYNTATGNTPCVLVDTDKYYIVFDAGEGIYKLDDYIKSPKPIYLFLSHFHLDHIGGMHILNKFRFNQTIRLYGQRGTRSILHNIIKQPFTCAIRDLPFKLRIHELTEGMHRIPFRVLCKQLLHADPCLGYRIQLDGKVISYCTDTGIGKNSLPLARNADLLIHDAAGDPKQPYPEWPHATPTEAAGLAKKANVKQLALFHFSAAVYKTMAERQGAEKEARSIFENTIAAMDGMELVL